MTPKAKETTTTKQINLTSLKLKTFGASKDNIKRVKGQPKEWKKIFSKHICDKGLISRIYTEFLFFF